jgi:hypothetical protein
MSVAPGDYSSAKSVAGFKESFFDSAAVLKAMDRTTARSLSKFGAFVRQRARTSIKKAPKINPRTGQTARGRRRKGVVLVDATARPGMPPFGHDDQKLKRLIFFAYDRDAQAVVIGPAWFANPRGGGPKFIEYGGQTMIRNRGGRNRSVVFDGNPFMNPAAAAEMPNLMKFFRENAF